MRITKVEHLQELVSELDPKTPVVFYLTTEGDVSYDVRGKSPPFEPLVLEGQADISSDGKKLTFSGSPEHPDCLGRLAAWVSGFRQTAKR
jgi:hypothetical protein